MFDLIFVIIGVGAIVAYLIAWLVTSPTATPPPQVVYVPMPVEPRRGSGCLPFVAGMVVTLIALALLAGV